DRAHERAIGALHDMVALTPILFALLLLLAADRQHVVDQLDLGVVPRDAPHLGFYPDFLVRLADIDARRDRGGDGSARIGQSESTAEGIVEKAIHLTKQ